MIQQEVLIKNITVMRDFYQKENTDPIDKVINNLFLLITYFSGNNLKTFFVQMNVATQEEVPLTLKASLRKLDIQVILHFLRPKFIHSKIWSVTYVYLENPDVLQKQAEIGHQSRRWTDKTKYVREEEQAWVVQIIRRSLSWIRVLHCLENLNSVT